MVRKVPLEDSYGWPTPSTLSTDALKRRCQEHSDEHATDRQHLRTSSLNPMYVRGDDASAGATAGAHDDVFGDDAPGHHHGGHDDVVTPAVTRVSRHLDKAAKLIDSSIRASKRVEVIDEVRELKAEVRRLCEAVERQDEFHSKLSAMLLSHLPTIR